ncbi:VOC family protein [Paenibacillus sp. NEAU-GSW1]|uniref:VOC family protein n=1 Tax=Paenibacillus sp. NEAU-GSW1 TaxID=2682486 RepID=UPI0012E2C03A|nr:VOC family protein [Paenibacillus sp. NEAU-GSW1]MUT64687.1 VOC family protein [Paenibacillus sp. NEAU-GSW1]
MTAQLNAYIHSEDARAQAAFYAQALGGEILSAMTYGQTPGTPEAVKDKVMHMVLSVAGGNLLFFSDAMEPFQRGRFISLALTYGDEAEARRAFEQLAADGTVKYPFELQPWGAYYGEIEDKFGVNWQIVEQ